MGRIVFYATFLAAASLIAACEEEKNIQANELPTTSLTFVETHFPDVEITAIVREKEGAGADYTVYLANGFDIEFSKSGEWNDVDGRLSPLPESVLALLPESLPEYVAAAFPKFWIVEVNRERYGYEIGLSNGIDLKFNSSGHLIGADD
ncbi:MAG: PepSY-like domain-containing protein [Prevotellaceae bacterium]|jgi:hypothetical protein|nr:PepSY-like domain-containing protein [Prevotellaceae bacterium]